MRLLTIHFSVPLIFGSMLLFLGPAIMAQEKDRGPRSEEERQLTNAQKAKAEAQAEYYRMLTSKIRQPEPSPTPHKTMRDSIVENPVSISAIIAALLAAGVGLLNLSFNNRNSIKVQRDTQFYEALKRYGDKDSATTRASAAGLLGQMGQVRWRRFGFHFQKERPFVRSRSIVPYLDTALDQLVSGLLLEGNPVVITSTENAIRQLIPFVPNNAALRLREVNLRLQEELTDALAEYFVRRGLETIPPTSLDDRQHWHLWEQLGSLISFHHSTLRDFVARSEKLSECLDAYLLVRNSSDTTGERLALAQNRIRNISRRLESNQKVLSDALRQAEWKERQWFSGSFLVSADLSNANLSHLDFHGSFMVGAWFLGSNLSHCGFIDADLRGASFHNCNLRGAWFSRAKLELAGFDDAELTDTKLWEAKIRDVTKLRKANWWKADFYSAVQKTPDIELLKLFVTTFPEHLNHSANDAHESVREYVVAYLEETPANPSTLKSDSVNM